MDDKNSLEGWSDIIRKQGEEMRRKIQEGHRLLMKAEEEVPLSQDARTLLNIARAYTSGYSEIFTEGINENQFDNTMKDMVQMRKLINAISEEVPHISKLVDAYLDHWLEDHIKNLKEGDE